MRSTKICSGILAVALCSLALTPAGAGAAAAIPVGARYVPGEVVVSFRDARTGTRTAAQASAIAAAVGGHVVKASSRGGAAVVTAGPGGDVESLVRRLSADPRVRFAEPNYIYSVPISVAGAASGPARPDYLLRKVQGLDKRLFVPKATLRAMRSRTASGTLAATYPTDKGLWDNAGWDWVGASIVWNNKTASKNVCVIDTGVDYLHKDLLYRVTKGWDTVNEDADPMDDNGHGTHVAGIIVAKQNNAEGIAGVSPTAKVVAVKALNAQGYGTSYDIQEAILYCARRTDVSIINMSLGGPFSLLQEDAVATATNDIPATPVSPLIKGKILVAAAGNDASDMPTCSSGADPGVPATSSASRLTAAVRTYPAGFATESSCYNYDPGTQTCVASATCGTGLDEVTGPLHAGNPAVLSVGAGGDDNVDYACQSPYTNFGSWVTITAPGTEIYSTTPWDKPFTLNVYPDANAWTANMRYEFMSGTSMAAPFVAGGAARAWGALPLLSNIEIVDHLKATGTPLATAGCWDISMDEVTDLNVAAALDRGALTAVAVDAVTGLPLVGGTVSAYQPLGVGLAIKATTVLTAAQYTSPFDTQVYTYFPSSVDLINLPAGVQTTLKISRAGYTVAPTAAFVGGDVSYPDGTAQAQAGVFSYAGSAAIPPKSARFSAVSVWDIYDPTRMVPELTTWLPIVASKSGDVALWDGQVSDFAVNYESCAYNEPDTAGELSVFPNAQLLYADKAQVAFGGSAQRVLGEVAIHAVQTHQIATRVGPTNVALPQYTGAYVFRVYNPDPDPANDFDSRQGSFFIWKDGVMKLRVDKENVAAGDGVPCTSPWWTAATIFSGKTGAVTYTPVDECVEAVALPTLNCP
jgi:subtilisin family serine protease